MKIWKTNLARLKDINKERVGHGRLPIDFDDKKILKWVKKHWKTIHWNGRQIRNAFQTAMALTEFKAKQSLGKKAGSSQKPPLLETEHFKLLAATSAQFSEYLRVTHGDDEEEEDSSSASEKSESESDNDNDAKSESSDESESEESEHERRARSKKAKKVAKKEKGFKSKSTKDGKKDKKEGKGRKK